VYVNLLTIFAQLPGDRSDIIYLAVFLVIAAISWVSGLVKNWLLRQQQQRESSAPPKDAPQTPSRRTSFDEQSIAKYREQLERRTQQRRTDQDGVHSDSKTTVPTNLTIPESSQRQRAKEQYEQRAAVLRQQEVDGQAVVTQADPSVSRPRSVEQAGDNPQTSLEQRQLGKLNPRVQPLGDRLPLEVSTGHDNQSDGVRRAGSAVLPDIPPNLTVVAKTQATTTGRLDQLLASRSLRSAIVLKEILDSPVGLRKDGL
tara:strand:+ start:571 stop:1341 length:771 start_codon:yes stop_codon:yes gene_type:complete